LKVCHSFGEPGQDAEKPIPTRIPVGYETCQWIAEE